MNIKESYEYLEYLEDLFNTAIHALDIEAIEVIATSSDHNKKLNFNESQKSNSDLKSDVVPIYAIIDFITALINERVKIQSAISEAKRRSAIFPFDTDVDAESTGNKLRKVLIEKLDHILITNSTILVDSDCKASDGVKNIYVVTSQHETSLPFDRMAIKATCDKLKNDVRIKNTDIQKLILSNDVYHSPAFDINNNYADALVAFMNTSYNKVTV